MSCFRHLLVLGMTIFFSVASSFYSRVSNVQPGAFELPQNVARMFEREFIPPFGLYLPIREADGGRKKMTVSPSVDIKLLTSGRLVCGIAIEFAGIELRLLVAGRPIEEPGMYAYRPKHINFFKGNMVACLSFVWPSPGSQVVWLSHSKPDAELPKNI
jgi:hypothetical protein